MTDSKTRQRILTGDEDFDGLDHAAATLPASWYYDPARHQHELEQIFYRHWIYLCHASTLAAPRDFRRFRIGAQDIFLVRDDSGILRGFHNSCRHRGSVVCQQQQGRFERKLIQCPYHQWAYALDGSLLATTSHAQAPDFDRADYPLHAVAVREWRGGIFVSLADEPPALDQGFERGADRTENWPLAGLVVGHRWNKVMQCNWKVFWENFNECLHCPNVHPELCELVPIYGRRISYYRDDPNWPRHADSHEPRYRGGLRDGARSWSLSGEAHADEFTTLSEEEIRRGQSYFVSLPSVFIAAHVDYMRSVRILPLAPEQTEIEVEWLFLPQSLRRDDFDLADITDFGKLVMQQDAAACELNQQGLHSLRFDHGVLMPEEHYVKGFQDWIRQQAGGGD